MPTDFDLKGDHPTVRKMVRRGRATVEGALGEEGWQTHAEAMTAKMSDWLSRSWLERAAEIESEALNIDYEQALQRIEQEKERHGRWPRMF